MHKYNMQVMYCDESCKTSLKEILIIHLYGISATSITIVLSKTQTYYFYFTISYLLIVESQKVAKKCGEVCWHAWYIQMRSFFTRHFLIWAVLSREVTWTQVNFCSRELNLRTCSGAAEPHRTVVKRAVWEGVCGSCGLRRLGNRTGASVSKG